ncbi:hypothetical protein EJ06DRAFT_560361 [Trichodelitschia bisporula]|uniref:Uncharacterized protein n=1 Tax=Trichodelitschia bisporula TaxID=703511 RepID=A0A6G1HJE8_9PEZI|nr:hypothetical protein EJ06DRAFT_560361 [Trichodelitschia bisporula]
MRTNVSSLQSNTSATSVRPSIIGSKWTAALPAPAPSVGISTSLTGLPCTHASAVFRPPRRRTQSSNNLHPPSDPARHVRRNGAIIMAMLALAMKLLVIVARSGMRRVRNVVDAGAVGELAKVDDVVEVTAERGDVALQPVERESLG